jgi:hypothetical protein
MEWKLCLKNVPGKPTKGEKIHRNPRHRLEDNTESRLDLK